MRVDASDLSENQIRDAFQASNIYYQISKSEHTNYNDQQFDLITVAQAMHWFDFDGFYREVNGTLKQGGIIAIWGYSKVRVSPEIDSIFDHFYSDIVGAYWDAQRKYVDNCYASIPFPFHEIETENEHQITAEWSAEHFLGYLNSWSSVQNYIKENGSNPVDLISSQVYRAWGLELRKVQFPIFLRLGKKS